MNKKIFGIKIATIIQFLVCFILAVLICLIVKYNNMQVNEEETETGFVSEFVDLC